MTAKPRPGWKPGQSGNPKGKPPGSGGLQKLRASIEKDIPDILAGLVTLAKAGDVQAARLLLERVLPPVKAIDQPVIIKLPAGGTLTDMATALMKSAADGVIAPSQAAQLIAALGSMAKIEEVDATRDRMKEIEAILIAKITQLEKEKSNGLT